LKISQHQRHVGFAPDNRARLAHGGDNGCVGAVFRPSRERRIARGGGHVLDVEAVLDRHGKAGQGTERFALGARLVDRRGRSLGARKIRFDDGVERFGELVVSRSMSVEKLARRYAFGLQIVQKLACRCVRVHALSPVLSPPRMT
jgi:hypothetical protein